MVSDIKKCMQSSVEFYVGKIFNPLMENVSGDQKVGVSTVSGKCVSVVVTMVCVTNYISRSLTQLSTSKMKAISI